MRAVITFSIIAGVLIISFLASMNYGDCSIKYRLMPTHRGVYPHSKHMDQTLGLNIKFNNLLPSLNL